MFIKWPVTTLGGTPSGIMGFHTTAFDVQMRGKITPIMESNVFEPTAQGCSPQGSQSSRDPVLDSQQPRSHRKSKEGLL